MATYDSIHTGEQVDNAVDIVLGNKSKGSATQPIYLDANGAAQNVNVDADPTQDSQNLVQSGGVFTQLSTKYAKADISTDDELGTSNVLIPSQGAVKTYVDTKLATKQDVVVAGDGIVKEGNTLSISTDNDFMTTGKLDNKWNYFSSSLDMGYGTEIIEKMEKAKKSTFDLSKFTVVGSPNITDDGIMTNAGSAKGVRLPIAASDLFNHDYDIISPAFYVGDAHLAILDCSQYGYGADFQLRVSGAAKKILFALRTGDAEESATTEVSLVIDLPNETLAQAKVQYRHSSKQYKIAYKAINSDEWVYSSVYTATTTNPNFYPRSNTDKISSGVNWYSGADTTPVDLKYMRVFIDGVEVFSGNKTGIDTIKPDNYTVVGTPMISADGIASGFSSSDYLTTANINKSLNTFKIEGEFVTSDSVTTSQMIFAATVTDSNSTLRTLALQQLVNGTLYCYIPRSSGGDWIVGTTVLQVNTKYYFKINFDGVNVAWSYGTDKNNLAAQPSAACLTSTLNDVIRIGLNSADGTPFAGSIDLNAFKIYVDGNLVYQPCLKIPYTLTKDGKKIVDYNYKSRVEDEYGQAGFTPYYTLDTESRGNYTVVGSPNISSDFVASGFSSSNYLTTSISLNNSKPFKIKCSFTTSTIANTTEAIVGSNYNAVRIKIEGSNCRFYYTSNYYVGFKVTSNTSYDVIAEYDGSTTIKLYYKLSSDSEYTLTQNQNVSQSSNTSTVNISHWSNNMPQPFAGSIDLKQFSITVDDELAYQAVIPPNYTMATVKESAIVDSYDNGMNKWTKLANLTCKQQGSCTSGTAVTFTKPYIDTNYALSVPYTSGTKTKTGFTPSATGDWIANGKVNLNA